MYGNRIAAESSIGLSSLESVAAFGLIILCATGSVLSQNSDTATITHVFATENTTPNTVSKAPSPAILNSPRESLPTTAIIIITAHSNTTNPHGDAHCSDMPIDSPNRSP